MGEAACPNSRGLLRQGISGLNTLCEQWGQQSLRKWENESRAPSYISVKTCFMLASIRAVAELRACYPLNKDPCLVLHRV